MDNATISRTSVCAVKARYLDENAEGFELKNRVVSVTYLKEDSTGATLLEVLNSKIFSKNEKVKQNFTSITFDNAATMKGACKGLLG